MAYLIGKDRLQAIQNDLTASFASVAEKHGVALSWGRGHYGDTADLKLIIATVGESGKVESEERIAWRERPFSVESRGMKPEWLDEVVTLRGKQYRIDGLKVRSPKFCVVTEEVATGKNILWTAPSIIRAMARQAAAK